MPTKSFKPDRRRMRMTRGRAYFGKWAKAYKIDRLDPDAVYAKPRPMALRKGARKSRVGGRIAHDLTRLEPDETQRRKVLSEEFLKQRVRHFPADQRDDN